MNFIIEPRHRNDIAPFTFDTLEGFGMPAFFGKSFRWVTIAEEVMRAIFKPFVDWVAITEKVMRTIFKPSFVGLSRNFTVEKVMRAVFNQSPLGAPRNFTVEKVVCPIRYPFLCRSPRNFTAEKGVSAIFNLFLVSTSLNFTAEKGVSAIFNLFLHSAPTKVFIKEGVRAIRNSLRLGFTDFLACFLRGFTTITTFGQIVPSGDKCLKVSNLPTLHSIQRILRNTGVSDNFNRKSITPIFLNSVMDGTTLRSVTAQVISHTPWQIAISTDVLFATRRRKDIDSGIFHNNNRLLGCIANSVLLPMLFGGGRDLALRRG